MSDLQVSDGRRRLLLAGALLVAAAAVVAGVLALRDDDSGGDRGRNDPTPAGAEVVYQYHDASVPPEYHRSYTLTVGKGSARLVVDSYGDLIHDVTVDIDDALWQRTLDASLAYAGTESVESEGCTGGTADEITVVDGDNAELVHVFMDHCGPGTTVDIRSAVGEVLGLFDLATLLAVD